MKFETFKAGAWRQRYQYKSFEPVPVNHDWIWEDPVINTLLESANRALGELNAFSLIVPDIDLFIEMHVVKEAQTSSRIEGTQTGMDEALMSEENIQPEKRNDWREVRNYIDAVFIPPHQDGVPDLMGDLEKFWHNRGITVPHLVRLAISHYQFEAIHPFLDGNGRIGRLLIPLYLVDNGLLAKPSLYLSDFFERNRASYYDALMRVRVSNDLSHWVRFFLQGVAETASKGSSVFQQILALRNAVEPQVLGMGRNSARGRQLLNVLYRMPVVSAADVARELQVTMPTAQVLVRRFSQMGLLEEMTGQQRNRVYAFQPYLRLFTN